MASIAKDRAEPNGVWAQSAKIAFRFLFAAVAVIGAGWAVSNIRQVQPDSRAVVLRFGSVVRQQGAGLLIAWPQPIEQVVILPAADRQIEFHVDRFDGAGGAAAPVPAVTSSTPLGLANGPNAAQAVAGFDMSPDPRLNTGFLITGDSSIVHLQATLFYSITDPVAYLIAADHVGPALERLFIASAVSVIASRDLDSILVTGQDTNGNGGQAREKLRSDLVEAVNNRLADLAQQGVGLGVTIGRVDLVPAIPSGAKSEFDRVLVATQTAEQQIAEARTDAEVTMQRANQESDRILAQASARAQEQITTATTRTAAIAALSNQATPGISRQMLINQIYFDRLGQLLPKAGSVETVDPDSGSHIILPGPVQK